MALQRRPLALLDSLPALATWSRSGPVQAGLRGVPPGPGPPGADRLPHIRPNGPGLRAGPIGHGQRPGQRRAPGSPPPAPGHAARVPARAPARIRGRDAPGDHYGHGELARRRPAGPGGRIVHAHHHDRPARAVLLPSSTPPGPNPAPRLRRLPPRPLHRGQLASRLAPPPGHLPAGRGQQQMGAAAPGTRRQGSRSASGSPPRPAAPAPPGTSAPRRNGPGGSCTCGPGKSTRPSPPPAPGKTPGSGKTGYKARAGVEGLMHQAASVTGIRRARYLGLGKTRLEHLAAATADINVIRLDAWYTGSPWQDPGHPPSAHRPPARGVSFGFRQQDLSRSCCLESATRRRCHRYLDVMTAMIVGRGRLSPVPVSRPQNRGHHVDAAAAVAGGSGGYRPGGEGGVPQGRGAGHPDPR